MAERNDDSHSAGKRRTEESEAGGERDATEAALFGLLLRCSCHRMALRVDPAKRTLIPVRSSHSHSSLTLFAEFELGVFVASKLNACW
jgi:hypothetical protein